MKGPKQLEQAQEYSLQAEYDKAIALYTEAIRVAPKHPEAWYGRGYCHIAQGNAEPAIADFGEGMRLAPEEAPAYADYISKAFCMRAEELMKDRAFDRALADYNESIRLQPTSGDFRGHCWYRRGMCHLARGDYDAALADFDAALGMGYTGNQQCVMHLRNLAERLRKEEGQAK
jgi:Tfp pilus assembly protein PilF